MAPTRCRIESWSGSRGVPILASKRPQERQTSGQCSKDACHETSNLCCGTEVQPARRFLWMRRAFIPCNDHCRAQGTCFMLSAKSTLCFTQVALETKAVQAEVVVREGVHNLGDVREGVIRDSP